MKFIFKSSDGSDAPAVSGDAKRSVVRPKNSSNRLISTDISQLNIMETKRRLHKKTLKLFLWAFITPQKQQQITHSQYAETICSCPIRLEAKK